MPLFSGETLEEGVLFANALQGIIATVDTPEMCGWIVDLRGNSGGNMWPMLAGVGPVLGEGIVGAFVQPDLVATLWYYRNGASGLEPNNDIVRVSNAPYELILQLPTVAVLTGPVTVDAGEAVLTAFRGRNATRSFGLGTGGLSTANRAFILSDGALILLTVSTFADRDAMLYGGVMEPDSVVTGWDTSNPTVSDNVVQVAVDWITSEGDCVMASSN